MCGIAGIARAGGAPVERVTVERMCEAQEHRGPDARGVHLADGIGLGIQRLRVIDLVTGDQPVHSEDGSVSVVLNGEIYNFQALRNRLQAEGHRFRTEGDTEVIAHLYEKLGPACVAELHGMFAFALWDRSRRRLLLARDRVGKKPLFFSVRDGALSFASELRALMADPEVPREIDPAALDAYLAYGYIPAPMSVFRGVAKLLPAHTLLYSDGEVQVDRYWRLDYSRKDPRSQDDLVAELREQIRRSVRRRMVADVPMGAFLSGGIDSSAVVAAMAEQSPGPVRTFSIGFEDEQFNELPQARLIARRFGTEHHELVVRADAIGMLPQVAAQYGEPFADHSALPCFHLARFAREHVTVALNGDGGDESFAGYERYTTNMALGALDPIPGSLRHAAARLAGALPLGGDPRAMRNRLGRFAIAARLDPPQRYQAAQSTFTAADRARLYSGEFASAVEEARVDDPLLSAWRSSTAEQLLDRLLDIDVATYLPGDLLAKIDIATMAYSLEGRSPFLDHELMQFAASLPAGAKAAHGRRKLILRTALRGWIPDEILDAPKRGFRLPVTRWLRGELRDYSREVLLDPGASTSSWCEREEVARLLDEHSAGRRDHGHRIWTLLMLELWYQEAAEPRAQPAAGLALT